MRRLKKLLLYLAGQVCLTLVVHYMFRRLPAALTENAVMGWLDDQIATAFGLTSPDRATVISWAIPILLVAAILWIYHLLHMRLLASGTSSQPSQPVTPVIVTSPHVGNESVAIGDVRHSIGDRSSIAIGTNAMAGRQQLVGIASIVYNSEDNSFSVLKYDGDIKSVAVEQLGSVVTPSFMRPFSIIFVFVPRSGPFDIIFNRQALFGAMSFGFIPQITNNTDRSVSILFERSLAGLTPQTRTLEVQFYRKQ